MLKKLKVDSFVIAILVSILIAYFFPQLAAKGSPVPMETISSIGISLIFFFYGLNLSTQAIRDGINNWKLHLIVQSSTFLIFPLIVLLFYPLFINTSHETLWLAFLFMAALPSTVSSSVVMVSMAKGNLPAAIFNASISGIIGILLTPLWLTPFIKHSGVEYYFTSIYLQLITEIVMPLILGLSLRRVLGNLARRYKSKLDLFDKFIILLIIYKSFVQSFEDKVFSSVSLTEIVIMTALVIVLFYIMYFLTDWLAKLLKFSHADRITTQYCGTKKSLVHGTVFSKALFGQTSIVGIMLLPLMLYHAIQIFIISIYASRIGNELRRKEKLSTSKTS